MPYLSDQWLQEEFLLGTAEPGERCGICRLPFLTREPVVVMRYRHPETDIRSMPIRIYCHPCADNGANDIAVGPRGGKLIRASALPRDAGNLVRQYWDGLRDGSGKPTVYKSQKYWVMGSGYGSRGGRTL